VTDQREERRDFYVLLGLGGVAIALMYVFDVPYREGWMYWVGIPALTLAIAGAAWLALTVFRRWRRA
jgi:hypothetical protein